MKKRIWILLLAAAMLVLFAHSAFAEELATVTIDVTIVIDAVGSTGSADIDSAEGGRPTVVMSVIDMVGSGNLDLVRDVVGAPAQLLAARSPAVNGLSHLSG